MADHEVTTGEVYRLLLSVQADVRSMRAEVIGRNEYEADQESIDRRFQESAKVHTDLETKVTAVRTQLGGEITKIREGLEAAEKEQRQNRSKWALALTIAIVSSVLSIVAGVLVQGVGG